MQSEPRHYQFREYLKCMRESAPIWRELAALNVVLDELDLLTPDSRVRVLAEIQRRFEGGKKP